MPPTPFTRVALIGKRHESTSGAPLETARLALQGVYDFLQELGLSVMLEAECARALGLSDVLAYSVDELGAQADVGIAVGGDGTMLGLARQMAPHATPLIGINQGRLGFVTDISLDHYRQALPPMLLQGQYERDERPLMHGRVVRGGQCVFETLAMNDVVVHRGAAASMVELEVEADGRFIARHRADGMIVATPTGSTAYSLAAGGPILHPQLPGWALVPIAPQALSNRPIVLADPSEILIRIIGGPPASASFDTLTFADLKRDDAIIVRRSPHHARFLHPLGWSYFDTLRRKLHWNLGTV